jgi:hypothetical protein
VGFVRTGLFLALAIGFASSASAAPITYSFLNGAAEFTIVVTGPGCATGCNQGKLFLPAATGQATFDAAVPEIVDIQLGFSNVSDTLLAPDLGPITLMLNSASIVTGTGFASVVTSQGGNLYSYSAGPLDVTADGSLTTVAGTTLFSGSTSVDPVTGFITATPTELTIGGLKMLETVVGAYTVEVFVEGSFRGEAVPEPSLIALLGLTALACARRRRA